MGSHETIDRFWPTQVSECLTFVQPKKLPGILVHVFEPRWLINLGVAQKTSTGGANRRFWSMFPLPRASHLGTGFLSHSHICWPTHSGSECLTFVQPKDAKTHDNKNTMMSAFGAYVCSSSLRLFRVSGLCDCRQVLERHGGCHKTRLRTVQGRTAA